MHQSSYASTPPSSSPSFVLSAVAEEDCPCGASTVPPHDDESVPAANPQQQPPLPKLVSPCCRSSRRHPVTAAVGNGKPPLSFVYVRHRRIDDYDDARRRNVDEEEKKGCRRRESCTVRDEDGCGCRRRHLVYESIGRNDVLCAGTSGEGGGLRPPVVAAAVPRRHPGNLLFRFLLERYCYRALADRTAADRRDDDDDDDEIALLAISRRIVEEIRGRGGRFLRFVSCDNAVLPSSEAEGYCPHSNNRCCYGWTVVDDRQVSQTIYFALRRGQTEERLPSSLVATTATATKKILPRRRPRFSSSPYNRKSKTNGAVAATAGAVAPIDDRQRDARSSGDATAAAVVAVGRGDAGP